MSFVNKLSVVGACVVLSAAAVAAPQKGTNRGEAAAASGSAASVEMLRTASALVRQGEASKDALLLITAAKLIREAGATTESSAKRLAGKPGQDKSKPDLQSADAVLAQARALAANRPDLLALADDVAKAGARGAISGPGRLRTVVSSGATDQYRVTFRGNEAARVFVSGDGDSDLDLYVYDENGNLVCRDDDNTDDMICAWTPKWTGSFTIRVRNRGMANQYVIIHN